MNSKINEFENIDETIKAQLDTIEEKYKHLFKESPFSIAILNASGVIIDFNPFTEKLFGYTRSELLGKNYLALSMYPPELIPVFKEHMKSLIEGKSLKPAQFKVYKKDGNPIWIMTFLSLIKLKAQTMVQVILLDMTERKEHERILKRKLEIESTISTISSLFIGDVELDKAFYNSLKKIGNLYSASRGFILLYNEEDILELFIQVSCSDASHVELINLKYLNVNDFQWCQEKYADNGYIFISNTSELSQKAKNTKKILEYLKIASLLIYPLIIKGNLKGFLGFDSLEGMLNWNHDDLAVTQTFSEIISSALDRKWSNETLRGSNQLLAGVLSSLTEIIALVDKQLNLIWTNNVAKAKFGKLITGKKCYKTFINRERPCQNCIAFKTFSDGLIHETELDFIDMEKNNLICWATSTPAALDYAGETELTLIISRDITKKKEIENELKQMNEHLIQKVEERTLKLMKTEENYRQMLNELNVGFYRGEFKGKLLKHNFALNKIFGIDPNISLIGSDASQFFLNKKIQDKYYKTLIKDGHIQNFKVKLITPQGEHITVRLNSHLIRDEKGLPSIIEGTLIKD
ncbi:MAG: PAS domain S-box protein [Promethearchaeota archaeon]|nr:MAG: PAS domain S-box protein [Candidatus Lokiarchaeota archaeon]